MAKNPPAFQLYASDLLGGVMAMSDEACGVYVKLLCALWIQGGTLPYDHHRLAVCALTTPECFKRVWPEIENKFVVSMRNDNGRNASVIFNQRLEKTRENQYVKATAGRSGGLAAQAKRQAKVQAELEQSAPMKTEERRVKSEDRRPEIDDWVLPDGWECTRLRAALEKFEGMRLDIRKPIRSRSRTSGIFSRFSGPEHLIAALDECTANEWQGLKPEYGQNRRVKRDMAMTFEQQKLENSKAAAKDFITDDRIR